MFAANIAGRIKRWSLHSETELVEDEIASEIANTQYHKECYIRFCDKTKIERAEKRIMKQRQWLLMHRTKVKQAHLLLTDQHLNMCAYHHEHGLALAKEIPDEIDMSYQSNA